MKREKTNFEQGKSPASFSLLYPPGTDSQAAADAASFLELGPAAAHDLRLEEIIAAFAAGSEYQKEIRPLFYRLPRDPEVIVYRQDVLEDLLANSELVENFPSLFPMIDSLFNYTYRSKPEMSWLHEVVWRAGELQNIIDCYERTGQLLGAVEGSIRSEGLRSLLVEIRALQSDPTYQNLVKDLPVLLSKLQDRASITIGVNLDASLRPVQATLLSVNEKPFTSQSLLNQLFGARTDQEGIGPLHSVPRQIAGLDGPVDPMMVPLFADLARVMEKAAIPIADQLKQYAGFHGKLFMDIRPALIFYLGAARIIRRLEQQGLSMCRPQIAPAEERRCEVKDSFNVDLVLRSGPRSEIVTNDLLLGPAGHIFILTGPNGGGKTTFMQGAGLVLILAQAGCYVPGTQAVISPMDQLFTHFPLEEKPESGTGRFGEEAIRLGKIFEQVTRHSLVLLNESLSSTSFSESLYLAEDLVRLLRRIGARAIYSTHLHELANRVEELNDSVSGESKIVSVVASPLDAAAHTNGSEAQHKYKIEIRPPLGKSYAREIAARYGISYQQLESVLSGRGVL